MSSPFSWGKAGKPGQGSVGRTAVDPAIQQLQRDDVKCKTLRLMLLHPPSHIPFKDIPKLSGMFLCRIRCLFECRWRTQEMQSLQFKLPSAGWSENRLDRIINIAATSIEQSNKWRIRSAVSRGKIWAWCLDKETTCKF